MIGWQTAFPGTPRSGPMVGRAARRSAERTVDANARARSDRGYTLIEVMITLVIVAILTLVALPAYNNTMVRANRAAAQSYLLDLANRQEQYLLDARTYTTSLSALLAIPDTVVPYYTVTITVPAGSTIANAYLITATPVPTSMQKSDGNLTLNQDGAKTGTW